MKLPPILDWNVLSPAQRVAALQRPAPLQDPRRQQAVAEIFERVRQDGDAELRDCTRRFDGVELAQFEVRGDEFAAAEASLDPQLRQALVEASARLETWHAAGMPREFDVETAPGVRCGRVLRGLDRVGLYVPAGSAPLPSTALMLGVPARLAGVREVIVCTPPRADGSADPVVLAAARLCGTARVFKLGGAQAIAAMALGTETVPACDKLFGPGNAWVTAAKQYASALPGARPSTCPPVLRKYWSSPMPAPIRGASPPTCFRRPNTVRTRRYCCSPTTTPCSKACARNSRPNWRRCRARRSPRRRWPSRACCAWTRSRRRWR